MKDKTTVTSRLSLVNDEHCIGSGSSVFRAEAGDYTYLIADDHPSVTLAVCQMLSELLGVSSSRFSSANTCAALLEACAVPTTSPRIVVLDLVMPGELKRLQLVRSLLACKARQRLLIYTAAESPFLARAVIDAGAHGYVAKTSPTTELMDALAAVAEGRTYVDRNIDLDSLDSHPWTSLTESERSVLISFCRGAKAHEIVQATGRTYSTVTTHKYNGLSKIGVRDGNDLLAYIYENGLLHELDADQSP